MAFNELKNVITMAPVLLIPDPERGYHLEADSSDFATGAVLSQQSSEDRKWHPVAFYSKVLSPVDRTMKSTIRKCWPLFGH